MKFSYVFYAICFILSFANKGISQNKKEKNSTVEIIDFGERSSKKTVKSAHPMIIKTSPISPVFGKGILEVEREITEYMSIQLGIGVKFKPLLGNNISNLWSLLSEEESSIFCESTQWENDICDDFNDSNIRKYKPGIILSVSPRFFFESDGFEGSYIAPVFRYSKNNIGVQAIEENFGSINRLPSFDVNETVKNLDFVVHYGSQILYPKLSWEYFVGIGGRKETATRQDLGIDERGINRNGTTEIKSTYFILEGGIRLGFQL